MKTEKEIMKMFRKLTNNKGIEELDSNGFISYTDKSGHWEDCLAWILDKEE